MINQGSPSAQSFSATALPKLACYLTSISILITYTIAVAKGDVKPFPHTTITNTAVNYPQYIIFRIGNLTAIPIMALVLVIVYWWLSSVKQKISQSMVNNGAGQLPYVTRLIIPLGFFGAFLFAMTVATISDGYMNNTLHLTAAVLFFVVMCIDFFVITLTIRQMYLVNPSFITKTSYYSKWVVCGCYFIIVGAIIVLVIVNGGTIPQTAIDAIEWITTTLLVIYISTFISDFENLSVTIENGITISWTDQTFLLKKSTNLDHAYINGNNTHFEMARTAPGSFNAGAYQLFTTSQSYQQVPSTNYPSLRAPWQDFNQNYHRVSYESANGFPIHNPNQLPNYHH